MTHYPSIQKSVRSAKVVAVSKGQSYTSLMETYEEGCRDFGENRVQEALEKIAMAPEDINWHFIGSLQKNKVNKVVGKFKLIHSVDTLELGEKIAQSSLEQGVITDILLQVNTSGEKTKHGMAPEVCKELFAKFMELPGVNVKGLMTMAPFIDDEAVIRRCFADLRLLRDLLQLEFSCSLPVLSMGMSHDYKIALEEGATLVRIGTAIFK